MGERAQAVAKPYAHIHSEDRFISRIMIETTQRLHDAADQLASERVECSGGIGAERLDAAGTTGLILGHQQQAALVHIARKRGLAIVVGYAGTVKSVMLDVAREEWAQAGRRSALRDRGPMPDEWSRHRVADDINLEHRWSQGRDMLTSRDMLVDSGWSARGR